MEDRQPSRTAQGAAMLRAAHQLLDEPLVFADPLAVTIIGRDDADALRESRGEALTRSSGLRAFIAVRSRFAEDCLEKAVARGVGQYVLLGAGLDTFAYRAPPESLRVFEVDHPATQNWKRARLAEAGIPVPHCVTYTAVDFERQTLREGLAQAAFVSTRPAFFAWLGVTPYLSRDSVMDTLSFIAELAVGTEIVFDYAEQRERTHSRQPGPFEAMAARVAAAGEPFRSLFAPKKLRRDVRSLGFSHVEDLDAIALNERYFRDRRDGLALAGRGRLMRLRV